MIDTGAAAYLRHVSRTMGDGDLRPYLPKEVCKILRSVCEYQKTPLVLDKASVDRVASVYFTKLAERDRPHQPRRLRRSRAGAHQRLHPDLTAAAEAARSVCGIWM